MMPLGERHELPTAGRIVLGRGTRCRLPANAKFGAVCLWLAACSSAPAAPASTPAAPSAAAPSAAAPSAAAPSAAAPSALTLATATNTTPRGGASDGAESSTATQEHPLPLPAVSIALEPPYVFGARPVSASPIPASVEDTELGRWNQGGRADPAFPSNHPSYHPAVRVVIDTRPLQGKKAFGALNPRALLSLARRNGYWPYRLCFEDGLRARRVQRGKTVLRFSIDVRGRVTYARRLRSELAKEVADCLRKVTYGFRFEPAPARRVDVELTVSLSAGDVSLPPRDAAGTPSNHVGQWPVWLQQLTPQVARCYAQGVARDAKLWGRIEVRLRRDANGHLGAEELHSRFPDVVVTGCVLEALRAAPESGAVVAVGAADIVAAWRLGAPPPEEPASDEAAPAAEQRALTASPLPDG
jgi:hypothetical protein